MDIKVVAHTLFSRFLLLLLMLIYLIPALIFLILPNRWGVETKAYYWLEYIFCWIALKISFVPFTFNGLENIPDGQAIIVVNHQSSFDIPVVVVALRRHAHMWLAIKTLMKSPILRFILPRVAVLVDTSSPIAGMRSLLETIKLVSGKTCDIVIFPEGGRYDDGQVHDFFGGYVILAKKLGCPVVPIYINGLDKFYPVGTFWIHSHPVSVTVGKPMRIENGESDEVFNHRVHHWFVEKSQG